jgi:hypothetical protein
MKRFAFALITAAALAAASVIPALADAGSPGSTFPEQPGSHLQTGCAMVTSNPGTGAGGVVGQHQSPTGAAITSGLLADACFGG